jgi:hypothetical protein
VKPRRLTITAAAARDLDRRVRYLTLVRGGEFAAANVRDLTTWLESLASGGAQLGTALGRDPTTRTFGYRGQATIVVRYFPTEMRVIRVFFTGQDWTRGSRRR